MSCRVGSATFFFSIALLVVHSLVSQAQEQGNALPTLPPSSSTSGQPGVAAESTTPFPQESASGLSPEVEKLLSLPEPAQFRTQSSASLLGALPGILHVGPIHLDSIDAVGLYDQLTSTAQPTLSLSAGVFRANFVVEKTYRRNRFAFQYQPQLDIIDGHLQGDLMSHGANLSTYFALTRRLGLLISDQFNYVGSQNGVLNDGLYVDAPTGYTAQNTVLERSGHWAMNNLSTSMTYDLSARTQVSINPNADWGYTTAPGQSNRGIFFGGDIGVTRRLAPQKTIGGYYGVQENQFTGSSSFTRNHHFGINYSQQVWGRWSAQFSLGAVTQATVGRHWTGEGSIRLTKAFRRSAVAVAYSRGNAFVANLTNGFVDQVDLNYSRELSRRLEASISVGAYGEVWSPGHGSSKYGTASLQYNFFSSLGWYFGYTRRQQRGTTAGLLAGDFQHLVTGLRWSPTFHQNY